MCARKIIALTFVLISFSFWIPTLVTLEWKKHLYLAVLAHEGKSSNVKADLNVTQKYIKGDTDSRNKTLQATAAHQASNDPSLGTSSGNELALKKVPEIPMEMWEFVEQLSIPDQPKCTSRRQAFLYIKTHKTGSETMSALFRRFGLNHNLTLGIPVGYYTNNNNLGWPWRFRAERVWPSKSGKVDAILDHSVLTPDVQLGLLQPGAAVITSVREAFDHMRSSFYYFKMQNYIKTAAGGSVGFKEFLRDVKGWDEKFKKGGRKGGCVPAGVSIACNGQALDLGFPLGFDGDPDNSNNYPFTKKYLANMIKLINIALVMEYFDESLLLMKRMMCWSWKDILYLKRNPTGYKIEKYQEEIIKNAEAWNNVDSLLYKVFNRTLWVNIDRLGKSDFMQELSAFKAINKRITSICKRSSALNKWENTVVLEKISPSKWDKGFNISHKDCFMISTHLRKEMRRYYDQDPNKIYVKPPPTHSIDHSC